MRNKHPETEEATTSEEEEVDVVAELKETRSLLDRLLSRTPPETDRPVPTHEVTPTQFSQELEAKQRAAREERVKAHQAEAAERQKQWEKDAPRRDAITARIAGLDQKVAQKSEELQALEIERAQLRRTL